MQRILLVVVAVNGILAVIAGTVAAHVLDDRVEPAQLASFQTGAAYHMYHTLALLGIAALWPSRGGKLLTLAAALFLAGIILFCGSVYLFGSGTVARAPLAPTGGFAFMFGWLTLAPAALARRRG